MHNLIAFIQRYNYWFLFIIFEVTSFVLLFRFNSYQGSAYITSANRVTGSVYEVAASVTQYFQLKGVNRELAARNIHLEQQVAQLRAAYLKATRNQAWLDTLSLSVLRGYTLHEAQVVNNSVRRLDNFITLNKGMADGVAPDMGVIDGMGVVGIVYIASAHYAVVIPITNHKSSISCKILGSDYVGNLMWDGTDCRYVYLKDLPQHAEYNPGDTIITSGYSSIFPEGVMVGTVEHTTQFNDGLSYMLKVKLSTDFAKLSDVWVIADKGVTEQRLLEQRME